MTGKDGEQNSRPQWGLSGEGYLLCLLIYRSTALFCEPKPEEVGFEPTRPLRAYRFSRPAHSTTLPLLQGVILTPPEKVRLCRIFRAFGAILPHR